MGIGDARRTLANDAKRMLMLVELESIDGKPGSQRCFPEQAKQEALNLLEHARTAIGGLAAAFADPQYSHDSRTLVLSVNAVASGTPFISIVTTDLCIALLRHGVRTRGAIVLGSAVHTTDHLSGVAMLEALQLTHEQERPRVAISPTAEAVLSAFCNSCPRDDDGHYFLDIFRGPILRDASALRGIREQLVRQASQGERVAQAEWLLRRIEVAQEAMAAISGADAGCVD
jgi:hypothetical protein